MATRQRGLVRAFTSSSSGGGTGNYDPPIPQSDVSGLTAALSNKVNAPVAIDDITSLQTLLDAKADDAATTAALAAKANTPVAIDDITSLQTLLDAKADDAATTAALAAKANTPVAIDDITSLQTLLDAKADDAATTAALAAKANTPVAIDDITSLQTLLDAKADDAATTAALDAKADDAATTAALAAKANTPVAIDDITSLQTLLDAKADDAATTAALNTKADDAATTAALDTKANTSDVPVVVDSTSSTSTTDAASANSVRLAGAAAQNAAATAINAQNVAAAAQVSAETNTSNIATNTADIVNKADSSAVPAVVDVLTSRATTDALSAFQGYTLQARHFFKLNTVEGVDNTDRASIGDHLSAHPTAIAVWAIKVGGIPFLYNHERQLTIAGISSGQTIRAGHKVLADPDKKIYRWDGSNWTEDALPIANVANLQTALDTKANVAAVAGVTTSTVVPYNYSIQGTLNAFAGVPVEYAAEWLLQGGTLTNAITESLVTQNPNDENDIDFHADAYGHGLKTVTLNGTQQQVYAFLSTTDGGASLNARVPLATAELWQNIYDNGAFWQFTGMYFPVDVDGKERVFTSLGYTAANDPTGNQLNRRIGGQLTTETVGADTFVKFRDTANGSDYIMDGGGNRPLLYANHWYDVAIYLGNGLVDGKVFIRIHGAAMWTDTTATFHFAVVSASLVATYCDYFVLGDGTGGDSNAARLLKEIGLLVYEASPLQVLTQAQTEVDTIIARLPAGVTERNYFVYLNRDAVRSVGQKLVIESNAETNIRLQDDTETGSHAAAFLNAEGQPSNTFTRDVKPGDRIVLENVLAGGQRYKVTEDSTVVAADKLFMAAYHTATQARTGQNNAEVISFNTVATQQGALEKTANHQEFIFNRAAIIEIGIAPQLRRATATNPDTTYEVMFYLEKSTNGGSTWRRVDDSGFLGTAHNTGITNISPLVTGMAVTSGDRYRIVWATSAGHNNDLFQLYAVAAVGDGSSLINDRPAVPSIRMTIKEVGGKLSE